MYIYGHAVLLCMAESSVQHVEAVLSQSELRQSGRGPDGRLLRVLFPYHSAQQRPAESLPQLDVADHVPLCARQRSTSYHHSG